MQDVELVEAAPPGDSELRDAGRRTRGPRRRVVAVVAGVAVLGALAVHQGAADARARADLEQVATVPGVLPPVGDRLQARWDRRDDGAAPPIATLAGPHLVAAETTREGLLRVQEVDRATGRPRWTTDVPAPAVAGGVDPEAAEPVRCEPLDDPGRAARVVCAAVAPHESVPVPPGPRATTFAVLDAADGTLVAVRTVSTELWTVRGDVVVLASSHDTGGSTTWVVLATDLTAADEPEPVWRTTTPPQQRSVAVGPDGQELAWRDLQTSAARVLLTDGDHAWLLSADGALLRSLDTGARVATLGRTGLVGLVDWSAASGFDRPRGALVVGDATLPVHETLLAPAVDDGTAADVEVLQSFDGPVVVRSGRTGGELWRSREDVTATVLLDGVLYAASPDGVVARDAVTGRRVWQGDGPDARMLATDGRVLLVLSSLTVRAYALSDGAPLWTQDVRALAADGSGDAWWLTTAWGMLAVVSAHAFTVVG